MSSGITLYIPGYNIAEYVDEVLEAALNQTRPADEVLLIDDGSKDNTVEMASKFDGVTVIRHEVNKGLSAVRNTAFKNAKYDLVASLDGDCVAEPDWLETLEKRMNEERIAGVGGYLNERFHEAPADLWRTVHMRQHWGDKPILDVSFLFGNNNIYRKSAWDEIGGFDERLRTNHEDVDICKRLRKHGYVLLYDPKAAVHHLKRDTVASVLRAYWRWTLFDMREPVTFGIALRKHFFNTMRMRHFVLEDIMEKRFNLLWIDLLLIFRHSVYDFKHLLSGERICPEIVGEFGGKS